jgi:hypothetical protein
LTFVLYPHEGRGSATFYEDAGDGYEYLNGFYARRAITCEVAGGTIRVVIGEQEGEFDPARRQVRLELREIATEPKSVQLDKGPATWRYDREQRRLVADLNATTSSQSIEVSMEE